MNFDAIFLSAIVAFMLEHGERPKILTMSYDMYDRYYRSVELANRTERINPWRYEGINIRVSSFTEKNEVYCE